MNRYTLCLVLTCAGLRGCVTMQPARPISELAGDPASRPRYRATAEVALVGPRGVEERLQEVRRLRVTADSAFWRLTDAPLAEAAVPLDRIDEIHLVRSKRNPGYALFGAAAGGLLGVALRTAHDASRTTTCSTEEVCDLGCILFGNDTYTKRTCSKSGSGMYGLGLLGMVVGAVVGSRLRDTTIYRFRNEPGRAVSWHVSPSVRPDGVKGCSIHLSF